MVQQLGNPIRIAQMYHKIMKLLYFANDFQLLATATGQTLRHPTVQIHQIIISFMRLIHYKGYKLREKTYLCALFKIL